MTEMELMLEFFKAILAAVVDFLLTPPVFYVYCLFILVVIFDFIRVLYRGIFKF